LLFDGNSIRKGEIAVKKKNLKFQFGISKTRDQRGEEIMRISKIVTSPNISPVWQEKPFGKIEGG
jgi:hypothetical protein